MGIEDIWAYCVAPETKIPQAALTHVEHYIGQNANATAEGAVAYLEAQRAKDHRIQPGTVDRLRRFIGAGSASAVDTVMPPPPPPPPKGITTIRVPRPGQSAPVGISVGTTVGT